MILVENPLVENPTCLCSIWKRIIDTQLAFLRISYDYKEAICYSAELAQPS